MSGLSAVGFFLISLLFNFLLFTLWLRIALRYLKVSSLNPLSHSIAALTNPLVRPVALLLRHGTSLPQQYDWPAFFTLFLVNTVKIICLSLIAFHAVLPWTYLFLFILADLIIQPCNILFYAVLIRVLMSYVNPQWRHPIADFLYLLTEPLLIWGRKVLPDISGFDFSPFVVLVILKVITLFISASLPPGLL